MLTIFHERHFNHALRAGACAVLVILAEFAIQQPACAQQSHLRRVNESNIRAKVILDTDIGDDIDDAFALGLALASSELKIVGVTTAWGDTELRARLVDRFLSETGRADIPVARGIATKSKVAFSQAPWALAGPPARQHEDAVAFLLREITENPGNITVIAIAPLTNLAEAIDRDPATFKKVQRVILMGGSIRRGYGDLGYEPGHGPDPEYNILSDVPAARKLLASGVPIFMMPLDSTQLKLDEVKRAILFSHATSMIGALTILYHEWGQQTPTLFDAMAVAYAIDPSLCPVQPLHIDIDAKGFTRETSGGSNVSACLNSDSERFFHFFLPRLINAPNGATSVPASPVR